MYLIFKNPNDDYKLYYGEIMSDYTLYIDIFNPLCIGDNKPDWKKEYVKSVYKDDYVAIFEDISCLKEYYPECFV